MKEYVIKSSKKWETFKNLKIRDKLYVVHVANSNCHTFISYFQVFEMSATLLVLEQLQKIAKNI